MAVRVKRVHRPPEVPVLDQDVVRVVRREHEHPTSAAANRAVSEAITPTAEKSSGPATVSARHTTDSSDPVLVPEKSDVSAAGDDHGASAGRRHTARRSGRTDNSIRSSPPALIAEG
jgi:hypothetical protein